MRQLVYKGFYTGCQVLFYFSRTKPVLKLCRNIKKKLVRKFFRPFRSLVTIPVFEYGSVLRQENAKSIKKIPKTKVKSILIFSPKPNMRIGVCRKLTNLAFFAIALLYIGIKRFRKDFKVWKIWKFEAGTCHEQIFVSSDNLSQNILHQIGQDQKILISVFAYFLSAKSFGNSWGNYAKVFMLDVKSCFTCSKSSLC